MEAQESDNLKATQASALPSKGKEKNLDKELELPPQRVIELRIPVLEETYKGLQAAIADNEWEEDEGLLTILALGLGYINAKRTKEAQSAKTDSEPGPSAPGTELDPITRELANYQGMYSVMKFKAYKFQEKSKILEMRESGLRASDRLREAWALRMRDLVEELDAENVELKKRIAEFENGQESVNSTQERSPSNWLRRLHSLWMEFTSDSRGA